MRGSECGSVECGGCDKLSIVWYVSVKVRQ